MRRIQEELKKRKAYNPQMIPYYILASEFYNYNPIQHESQRIKQIKNNMLD